MWEYRYADELYHHGVKGMKWGVRRYQKSDGSLTPLGRVRYSVSKLGDKAKQATSRAKESYRMSRAASKANKAAKKLKAKPLSELTDQELDDRIKRLKKEQEAFNLQRSMSSLDQKKVSAGKQFMSDIGSKVIGAAVIDAGRNVLTKWLNKKGMDLAGLNDAKDEYKHIKDLAAKYKAEQDISNAKKTIRINNEWQAKRDKEEAEAKAREKATKKAQAESDKRAEEKKKPEDSSANTGGNQQQKKQKKEKVHTGTVVGEGTSKRKTESGNKRPSDYYDPIDISNYTVSDVRNTTNYKNGIDYINRYLLED